jgi:hypothetical protein
VPASPLAVARFLRAQGISTLPVDHPSDSRARSPKNVGKVPAAHVLPNGTWGQFQERLATDAELVDMFGGSTPVNVGIITGAISGLVVVDADSPAAEAWVTDNLPRTPLQVRTGRGRQFYYAHPLQPVRNKVRAKAPDGTSLDLDLRADGGYVLAPGSQHASGATYQRLGDWVSPDDLPVFDPEWIDPPPAATAQDATTTTNAPAPRVDVHTDADHLRRRLAAYMATVEPAVEGQGGDAHTYRVCCRLVRGFNLTIDEAIDALHEWNATCAPPWSDRELRTKLANAQRYGDEPVGARLEQGRVVPFAVTAPAPVVNKAPAENLAPRRQSSPTGLVSIGDFLEQDDPAADYLVDNIIARGTVNLIVSKPKVGKSVLARAMCVAITQGRPEFLGYAVKPGTCWYLALEGRAQDHRAHFRQLGARSTDPLRIYCGRAPQKAIDQVRAWAEHEVPDVIVVDTLQRFVQATDSDNYAEMSNLFDPIIGLSRDLGCALVFLHHARKMADGALTLDAVHGSVAISGSVDNTILLARSDQLRTLATVQRIGTDVEESLLLLDETGWPYLGGSKAQAEREQMAETLLQALRDTPAALTREDWFDLVEGRREAKVSALRLLEQHHCLTRDGKGQKGSPFQYRPVPGVVVPKSGNKHLGRSA